MTSPPAIGVRDLVAFGCEVAMLIILLAAGHGMVSGWRGWVVGAGLALVVVMIWSAWMAPTSPRRLPNPTRFQAQIALFVTVALYAAAGGLAWWGVGFAVVAIAAFGSRLRTDP